MNTAIKQVTRNSKKEFSLFSLVGIPARLILRIILKCVKFAIKTQFINKLEERGEITISVQTVETQARRELIERFVLGKYRDMVSLYTYLLYGEFILLFGLPYGLFFLFQALF